MKVSKVFSDDKENEVEYSFPAKYEVCYRCEGHGMHLNPSIGNHAYSMEEFMEEFCEEEREEYFKRGGIYDVTCEVCHGKRVTLEIDKSSFSAEDKEMFSLYEKELEEIEMMDREMEAERRYGC